MYNHTLLRIFGELYGELPQRALYGVHYSTPGGFIVRVVHHASLPDENQIGKHQRVSEKFLRPLSNICQAMRGTFVVGESRKRSGVDPTPHRSKPSLRCIVRISSSLSFQTATNEYEVGYPEIRCSRDPCSGARKREIGRNFFRFVEIHCRYSVESRTFRGFSGFYNLPRIDAS